MYEHHSARVLSRRQFVGRLVGHLSIVAALVGASLLFGMLGYVILAGYSWVDAFLDAAMLLGGMGPVGVLTSTPAKIFAGVYALYAGLVFIVSASIIVAPIAHRILHKLHVEGKKAAK